MPSDQVVFIVTAVVLVFLGLASMVYSRNLIKTVMSFQVIVFGANLTLFSSGMGSSQAYMSQTFVLFSIFVGASVEAVALALIVMIHKKYGTLNPWEIRRLRH
ncbi:MAG TPA: NADH-quinone oxidoreductase subunit K [Nitrososphaerales archaeon]|nr:NADH-quinone oxidoreductase subunit K [Nitrososphaerales archaeon]